MTAAYISHQTPGRLRLKVLLKKGDGSFFQRVQKKLFQCEGVEKVEVNPLTGSILIRHHANTKAIGEFALKNELFALADSASEPAGFRQQVTGTFAHLDTQVKGLMSGKADIWNLVFLFLIGSGIYQLARGNFAAIPWYTAFYYAFNILQKAKNGGGE